MGVIVRKIWNYEEIWNVFFVIYIYLEGRLYMVKGKVIIYSLRRVVLEKSNFVNFLFSLLFLD